MLCDLFCSVPPTREISTVGIKGIERSMLCRNGTDREGAFGKRRRGLRGERVRGGGRDLKVEMDDPNG